MARRKIPTIPPKTLRPFLRRIVRSARAERPEHADGLIACLALAAVKAPARGIFDPSGDNDPDVEEIVDSIALQRFDLARARSAWLKTVDRMPLDAQQRDELRLAAADVCASSDTARFYAGLAFGLVFGTLRREI